MKSIEKITFDTGFKKVITKQQNLSKSYYPDFNTEPKRTQEQPSGLLLSSCIIYLYIYTSMLTISSSVSRRTAR